MTWLNNDKFMQRREYQLCLQGAHILVKLTHKLSLIFRQARSWMKPMGKGTSCLDISCHWRLFYPTEIRISTTGEKINYYPAKLTNMLPLVPMSSSGKFNPVSITNYWDVGVRMHAQLLSHDWVFVTPWVVAHQSPLFMRFFKQEYWSGLNYWGRSYKYSNR